MKQKFRFSICFSFVVAYSFLAVAQERKPVEFTPVPATPCGHPLEQSDIYSHPTEWESLLVTDVPDGRTIVVLLPNGISKRMKLGGVDVPKINTQEGMASQQYLSELVLGKRVRLLLYSVSDEAQTLGGKVSLETAPHDVNEAMLESGMARYKGSEYITSFDSCLYKLSAEKAQKEKKGLWQSYFAP
jgi:endonuclease YncB( thermonuclease family)